MLDQLNGGDIRAYGSALGAACTSVGDSVARLQGVGDAISVGRWTGPAGDACRHWQTAVQAQAARLAEAMDRVGSFAPRVAAAVEDAQRAEKAEQQAQAALEKASTAVQQARTALHAAQAAVDSARARLAEWVPHGLHPVPPPGPSGAELATLAAARQQLTSAGRDLDRARRDWQRAVHAFDEAEQHRKAVARAFAALCRQEAAALGVTLPNPPDPGVVVGDFLALTGFVRTEGTTLLQALDTRHPIPFDDLIGKAGLLATGAQTPLVGRALLKYNQFMQSVVDDVRALTPVTAATSPAEAASRLATRAQAIYWLEGYGSERLTEALRPGPGGGALALAGDVFTIVHPDFEDPLLANGERVVAGVNAASTGATVMSGVTSAVAGANESLDWVPGAAPWVALGSGIVLGGAYLGTHWQQTVGWVDHSLVKPYSGVVGDGEQTVELVGSDLSHGDLLDAQADLGSGIERMGLDAAKGTGQALVNVGGGLLHDAGSVVGDLGIHLP